MEKKILIAVDGGIHSRKAIEYCINICSLIKDVHYTLINIRPKISDFLIKDSQLDSKASQALKDVVERNKGNSMNILDESMEIMVKLGMDENLIEKVSLPVIKGTAKGILDYAKQQICDAIVVGDRGKSKLAEAFTGSIANNLLEHTDITPVWGIGGDIKSQKIMIAVDGSESALKAVDHVAFMIEGNPDIKVTLLHVTPKLRDYCTIEFDEEGEMIEEVITSGDKKCVDRFYTHAQQKFTEVGLSESQFEVKEVESKLNIGKTIVDAAKKEGCGTLVIGRRGANESFFMGSVSRYVLTNAKDCAVWLVP
ncbi:universal stress protein [Thermodesulfobacteriota bacterium]